jgi:hypothetical protein
MTAPPQTTRALAAQILEREITGHSAAELAGGIETAFGRLHAVVSALIGPLGFAAVMTRALYLARQEHESLRSMEVRADGTLSVKGLPAVLDPEAAGRIKAAAATLLATMITLLGVFIGTDLTHRLVLRAWNELSTPSGEGAGEV